MESREKEPRKDYYLLPTRRGTWLVKKYREWPLPPKTVFRSKDYGKAFDFFENKAGTQYPFIDHHHAGLQKGGV